MDSNSTRGLVLVREFHPDMVVPGQKNHDSYAYMTRLVLFILSIDFHPAIILDLLDHVGALISCIGLKLTAMRIPANIYNQDDLQACYPARAFRLDSLPFRSLRNGSIRTTEDPHQARRLRKCTGIFIRWILVRKWGRRRPCYRLQG